MKKSILIISALACFNCNNRTTANCINGTWKLVYAEIVENDSTKIKDLKNTEFIKIINDSHFAFFNQGINDDTTFYSGAGTYRREGETYEEILSYTSAKEIKNHKFSFQIKMKGDTLIQTGQELIKAAGINRTITEKYIKMN
ncbi:hypothetical protein Q4566_03665 [Tamlana sp. 2_MG-2023]|uniref:hypothetical protein n=1 Tax=unclassified Tamlana TaxID=2614803 RepID=UPI0026E18C9D|nr:MULTISPECIES: hypothetical protein [unclassified Tamlana]MDO6759285.1 hypothetical protein [Tamlana sp. 2_MG-2023]MDO6790576.1 hypothetical protein [Tamlana sp. 1_MG-2023]